MEAIQKHAHIQEHAYVHFKKAKHDMINLLMILLRECAGNTQLSFKFKFDSYDLSFVNNNGAKVCMEFVKITEPLTLGRSIERSADLPLSDLPDYFVAYEFDNSVKFTFLLSDLMNLILTNTTDIFEIVITLVKPNVLTILHQGDTKEYQYHTTENVSCGKNNDDKNNDDNETESSNLVIAINSIDVDAVFQTIDVSNCVIVDVNVPNPTITFKDQNDVCRSINFTVKYDYPFIPVNNLIVCLGTVITPLVINTLSHYADCSKTMIWFFKDGTLDFVQALCESDHDTCIVTIRV